MPSIPYTSPIRSFNYNTHYIYITPNSRCRCFNCNVEGHIASSCPIPNTTKRCHVCLKDDHLMRQCPHQPLILQQVEYSNTRICFISSFKETNWLWGANTKILLHFSRNLEVVCFYRGSLNEIPRRWLRNKTLFRNLYLCRPVCRQDSPRVCWAVLPTPSPLSLV